MEEVKKDREELEKIDIFRVLQEFWKSFGRLWWLPLLLAEFRWPKATQDL